MWSAARSPRAQHAVLLPQPSLNSIRFSVGLAAILLCFGIKDHFERYSGKTVNNDSFLVTGQIGKEVAGYFGVDLEQYINSWRSLVVDTGIASLIAALWPSLCKVLFRLVPEPNGGYNRLGLLSASGLPLLVLCLLLVTKEEHTVVSNGLHQPVYLVSNRHGGILLKSDQPPDLAHSVLAMFVHGAVRRSITTRFNGRVDVNSTHITCASDRDGIIAGTAHPFLMELRSICQELVGDDNQLSLYSVASQQGIHIDLATLGAHASTLSSPKEVYSDPNLISELESYSDFHPDSDNLYCSFSPGKASAAYCIVGPKIGILLSLLPPDPKDSVNFTASFVEKVLQAAENSTSIHETHVKIDQYMHSWRMVGILMLVVVTYFVRGFGNPGPKVVTLGESYDRGFQSECAVSESSLAVFEDPTVGAMACGIATVLVFVGVITLKVSTTSPIGFHSLTLYETMGSVIGAVCFLIFNREYRMISLNISISTGQGVDLSTVTETASPASHSKSLVSRFSVFALSVLFLSVLYSDAAVLTLPEITNPTARSDNTAARAFNKKEPTEIVTVEGNKGDQRKLGGIWYGNRNLQRLSACWEQVNVTEKTYYIAMFAPKIHTPGPGIKWDETANVGLVSTRALVLDKGANNNLQGVGKCVTAISDTLGSIEIPEYPTDDKAFEALQNASSVPNFLEGLGAENLKLACAAAACNTFMGEDGKEGRPTSIALPGAKLRRKNWLAWLVLMVIILLGSMLKIPSNYREFPIPLSTLAMERLGKRDKTAAISGEDGAPNSRGLMSVLGVLEGNPVRYGLTVSPIAITPGMVIGESAASVNHDIALPDIQPNPQDQLDNADY